MRRILLLLIIGMVISSCSTKVLLPYEENSLCNAGKQGGYCGSITDVYKHFEEQGE